MATTFEQAAAAKNVLRSTLGRPDWLRGVGVSFDEAGSFIKVNVGEATSDVLERVPREVNGVRVEVEAVGEIVVQRVKR